MSPALRVVGAATIVALAATIRAAPQTGVRTVHVSAVDGKQAPVPGLSADDFTIKEDGRQRTIDRVEIATAPMQIVLMLDDGGLALGAIRQGAGQFVERLQGKAQFAVITTGGRNLTLVDFTEDPRHVYSALQNMFARNQPATYLLDGLLEVSQTLARRSASRPVIVAIASEGEEFSHARSDVVLEAIQKSQATFYYVGLGPPATQGSRAGIDRPADSTESEAGRRNTVIGSAPKNSGGRSEQSLLPAGVPVLMMQFAEELAGQYAITYRSDSSQAKLTVETSRRGVRVRARSRVGPK
jgi:VWFA-related protein